MEQLLEAGEIVATHGIRGEVKLNPWADAPSFLLRFDRVQLRGQWYPIEACRTQKSCVLLKLDGVSTIEEAARLVGTVAYIDRADAALDEGVHFVADLIGLKVLSDGKVIGTIHDVLSMPGNDVYEVHGPHRYLIPVVREFVDEPDFASGTVTVRLIEGMQTDAD